MFGFGKKKPAPTSCPANPGIGAEAKVSFSNGARTWTEAVNVVQVAADVFKQRGYSVSNEKTWLLHGESKFAILPQLVAIEPMEGGVRTVTTMQVNHPTLAPAGVFEYQHSAADNVVEATARGFDQWIQTDFVPLLEALSPQPKTCTAMEMEFPAKEGKPGRIRRAILGPIAHFMEHPPADNPDEEHPFCPCCLLTRSFEAFKDLFERDDLCCLRFFAARDEEGLPQADCRINGEDWEPGAEALRNYASTWAPAGYEFRKQYVVLQSIERGGGK